MFNKIRYKRRKSKQILKEKASIFSESHKELFGQSFRDDWCTNLKTKQKYQEIMRKETKSTLTTFSRNKPPFRGGPPASSYGTGGGVRAPQAFSARTMLQTQREHGKSNKITLPQHSTTSGFRQVKSTSFRQKPFPCQSETGSSGRKSKILFRKLGKINSRCEYFGYCAGFQNLFLTNTFSVDPPPLAKVNQEERLQINSEIKKMLRKGTTQQVISESGEFLSNLFLVNKKDGGHRSVIISNIWTA